MVLRILIRLPVGVASVAIGVISAASLMPLLFELLALEIGVVVRRVASPLDVPLVRITLVMICVIILVVPLLRHFLQRPKLFVVVEPLCAVLQRDILAVAFIVVVPTPLLDAVRMFAVLIAVALVVAVLLLLLILVRLEVVRVLHPLVLLLVHLIDPAETGCRVVLDFHHLGGLEAGRGDHVRRGERVRLQI